MNKRTVLVLSTTMMSIATAACAFCVAQSANAAETSTTTGINAIVNSSANNFSTTSSNTVTSSTAGSNTPNEGGSAFDSASVKPAKSINEDRSVHDEAPVYDTADNYKKDSEDNDEITYSRKKDFSVDNPFPNIISNDEINEKLGKNSNETDITKIYFTPTSTNGGTASKPEIVNNSELKDVPGKYTVYYVLKKFSDNEHPTDLFAIYGVAIYGAKAEDGSIYPGSEQTTKIERQSFTISVNGCTIAENIKKIINIKMPSYNNYTYFKIVYNYDPSNLKIERFKFVYGPSGSVGHLQASLSFHYSRFAPLDDAQFHFVDDLQYHAINPQGVGDEGKLKQRGNSDQHTSLSDADKQKGTLISSVPFYEIKGLNNIQGVSSIKTDQSHYGRDDDGDSKTPILSYAGDSDSKIIKRPTLDELTTDKNIPGYVYWDNDIDKPQNKNHEFAKDNYTKYKPGNHYLSFAYEMKDGKPVKRLTRKHYYVTFRAIPTQLVVKYKKIDGTFESGATYGLLNSKNAQIGDQFAAASGDIVASSKDDLVAMMKSQDTHFIQSSTGSLPTGYLSKGVVYLLPGHYTVKPNVKAPDGYEWVVESTNQSSKSSADINIGLQTGDVAVQESVTFVLKKKPTPPTPKPEPEPMPTPMPETEPEPEAEPEPEFAPAPAQPEQPEQPEAKRVVERLPQTGSTTTSIFASAIASLFTGLAGLAESFAATRKRRN